MGLDLIGILPNAIDWIVTLVYRGEIKNFDKAKTPEDGEKFEKSMHNWTKQVDEKLDKKTQK